MAAAGTGETTSVGAAHVRGGQTAASVRVEDIYRRVYGEDYDEASEADREAFEQMLEDLVDACFLVTEYDRINERSTYRARPGLSWPGIVHLDCPKKKELLLTLIENPQTFFVLYNTQKGKMRIAAREIRSWATAKDRKVVAFLVVDNDKTLADQSVDSVKSEVSDVAEVFLLSSNSSETTLDRIQSHIDNYATEEAKPEWTKVETAGREFWLNRRTHVEQPDPPTEEERKKMMPPNYLMPVVVALNNATQVKKVIALMTRIRISVLADNSRLRYGVVFDEADKVYPPIRGQFAPLLVDDNTALHRLGFVTATDGDLMESDYEECANAHMYTVPTGDANYRAIHTTGAAVKEVPHLLKDSNDVYAEKILANHREHFKQTITLNNGTQGFRKTIVNGGGTTASMTKFARNRVADEDYAVTVNMLGIRVYRPGHEEVRFSTKGVRVGDRVLTRFGEILFHAYTTLGLHDRPLFIIGRRKVDRGLGFHYAPRDGSDGLVWTDMILGRVDDKDTAVQKAGRLAGVVAQCPQFPGTLTWWTDEKTKQSVTRHNSVVDQANTKRGCSALQAMTRGVAAETELLKAEAARLKAEEEARVAAAAAANSEDEDDEDDEDDEKVDIKLYRIYESESVVREVCKLLGYHYVSTKENANGFRETSLNTKKAVASLRDAVKKVPTAYGTNNGVKTYRTCYPCYVDTSNSATLRFVVIIRPGTDEGKIAECDRQFVPLPYSSTA